MEISRQRLTDQLRKLNALEAQFTFRISRMSKLLDAQAADLLTGSGLSLTSYRMLMVIDIFEEISAADLSRVMVIDRAQISRSAAELKTSNLIDARQDPTSKRRKMLRLTPGGEALLHGLMPSIRARQARLEGLLSRSERDGFLAAINRISAYLADELDRPDALPTELRNSG